jgi:hypothetical protein
MHLTRGKSSCFGAPRHRFNRRCRRPCSGRNTWHRDRRCPDSASVVWERGRGILKPGFAATQPSRRVPPANSDTGKRWRRMFLPSPDARVCQEIIFWHTRVTRKWSEIFSECHRATQEGSEKISGYHRATRMGLENISDRPRMTREHSEIISDHTRTTRQGSENSSDRSRASGLDAERVTESHSAGFLENNSSKTAAGQLFRAKPAFRRAALHPAPPFAERDCGRRISRSTRQARLTTGPVSCPRVLQ